MNLTEPPEVEDLIPDRAEQLRAALVARAARESAETRRRPAWVPAVVAVAGVAAVVTAAVLVGGLTTGRSAREPANSPTVSPSSGWKILPSDRTSFSPSQPPPVVMVPLPTGAPSVTPGTLDNDLGPATESDIRRVLQRCFQDPGGNSFRYADAAKAMVRWARWVPVTSAADFNGRPWPKPSAQLVVSVLRADRRAWTLCADELTAPPGAQMESGGDSATRVADIPSNTDAKHPIVTSGTGGEPTRLDGRWTLSWSHSFAVIPRVERAEFRITWQGGAGPWHTAYVDRVDGYAAVTASTSGAKPVKPRIEVRLFDKSGTMFYRTSTTLDGAIGYR